MAKDGGGKERRKRPRIPVKGEVAGRIHTIAQAPVVDISETGALLEVGAVLRPGTLYVLRLSFGPELHLTLRSRIVRTYVHSFQSTGGESVVTYRAAVEFIELSDSDRQLLRTHIDNIQGNVELEFE